MTKGKLCSTPLWAWRVVGEGKVEDTEQHLHGGDVDLRLRLGVAVLLQRQVGTNRGAVV